MKKREEVNITWEGTHRIKGVKPEPTVENDFENIQEYLTMGYGNDKFDPRQTLMTKQTQKINVVREGKETKMDVYQRD